jgi:NADPH:quinone reductase-like Zn-dependent oxidoreductase
METVVVTEYGGRAEAIEMAAPDAHAGQVLIKVPAAGMNPMDCQIAAGRWQSFMAATFPVDVGGSLADLWEREAIS